MGVMEIVLSYTSLLAHFGNGSTKEILLFFFAFHSLNFCVWSSCIETMKWWAMPSSLQEFESARKVLMGVAVHKVHATFLPVLMVNRYYILFMVNAVAAQF